MVIMATVNNTSVILGQSVLSVKETGLPGGARKKNTDLSQVAADKLYHIM